MGSSSVEQALVHSKLKKSQQWTALQQQGRQTRPGLHQPECCQQIKGCDYSTVPGKCQALPATQFWHPQFKRDTENLDKIPQRIVKMIRGLEKLKDAGIRVFFQFTAIKLQF